MHRRKENRDVHVLLYHAFGIRGYRPVRFRDSDSLMHW